MARRKKGRGRKNKTIPILPTVAAVYPAVKAYKSAGGFTMLLPATMVYQYTGYDMDNKTFDPKVALMAGGPVVLGFIGHKVANRIGVNRILKKVSMGYLSL